MKPKAQTSITRGEAHVLPAATAESQQAPHQTRELPWQADRAIHQLLPSQRRNPFARSAYLLNFQIDIAVALLQFIGVDLDADRLTLSTQERFDVQFLGARIQLQRR